MKKEQKKRIIHALQALFFGFLIMAALICTAFAYLAPNVTMNAVIFYSVTAIPLDAWITHHLFVIFER